MLGLLNKRNGIVRDLTLKPGQAMRVKDVTVRLARVRDQRAMGSREADRRLRPGRRLRPDGQWVRRFSGWLYKESPSLNVVEDPVYDVWPKSCAMNWPAGPDGAGRLRASSSSRSSASNSGGGNAGDAAADRQCRNRRVAPSEPPAAPADDSAGSKQLDIMVATDGGRPQATQGGAS